MCTPIAIAASRRNQHFVATIGFLITGQHSHVFSSFLSTAHMIFYNIHEAVLDFSYSPRWLERAPSLLDIETVASSCRLIIYNNSCVAQSNQIVTLIPHRTQNRIGIAQNTTKHHCSNSSRSTSLFSMILASQSAQIASQMLLKNMRRNCPITIRTPSEARSTMGTARKRVDLRKRQSSCLMRNSRSGKGILP